MNSQVLDNLKSKYSIVDVVDLGFWNAENYLMQQIWLENTLKKLRRESFDVDERIVFLYNSEF